MADAVQKFLDQAGAGFAVKEVDRTLPPSAEVGRRSQVCALSRFAKVSSASAVRQATRTARSNSTRFKGWRLALR